MNIDKIVFYHPSLITGGAEYLFLRAAEYLAFSQNKYDIYIIEYEDGFARKNAKNKDVKYIDYVKGEKTNIPDGSAVITQLNDLGNFKEVFDFNPTKSIFLFWCLHMLNIRSYIYGDNFGFYLFKFERKQLGVYLKWLSEKDIVKYMGYGAYVKIMKDLFQPPQQLRWLHNIVPFDTTVEPDFEKISPDEVKFCWLGRLDQEKARNIETYMNELEFLSSKMKLSLSLIGLGPSEDYLKEIAKKYSYPVLFVGELRNEKLADFIRTQSDIGLASGTSALEFSMRGKPVIIEGLLNRIYAAKERDRYFLTSESSSYKVDENLVLYRPNQGRFEDKVNQILSNYHTVSKECYEYVKRYAPENCCTELIRSVENIAQCDSKMYNNYIESAVRMLVRGEKREMFVRTISKLFKSGS